MPTRVADRSTIARGVLLVTADGGSRAREAIALQRLAGNQAVRTLVEASPGTGNGSCSTPDLQCTAKANRSYDKAVNPGKTTKSRDADGNVLYKGKAVASGTFKTTVDIHLATVPDGVSECAAQKLRDLIRTKLKPHEEEHKRRFLTQNPKYAYVGSWSQTVTATSDDRATAEADAMVKGDTAVEDEAQKRWDRNEDYAVGQIDPFVVSADISDCPECTGD